MKITHLVANCFTFDTIISLFRPQRTTTAPRRSISGEKASHLVGAIGTQSTVETIRTFKGRKLTRDSHFCSCSLSLFLKILDGCSVSQPCVSQREPKGRCFLWWVPLNVCGDNNGSREIVLTRAFRSDLKVSVRLVSDELGAIGECSSKVCEANTMNVIPVPMHCCFPRVQSNDQKSRPYCVVINQ